MRYLAMALVAMGLSCGPPVVRTPFCCTPIFVARDFGYVGSFASDGGTTNVQLIVNASGEATVSFVRGADQITQTFRTTN